ncbi:RDD family protein [mine drainage metagenome]|uniref:RDD family protein n=1 Tax=mine drainage metagenome TaxID=410659 RepID=A0A1J5R9G2_9ZZZZ
MSVMTSTPDPTTLGPGLSGAVPAPVGRRIGAALIDGSLILLVEAVAFGLAFLVSSSLDLLVVLALLAWGLVQWRMHATTGQTIGKRTVGIRTLAVPAGTAPGPGRTLGRYLLLGVANLFCFAGLLFVLSVFWDPDKLLRGWHDKAANVFLVDIRSGRDPLALRSGSADAGSPTHPEAAPRIPVIAPPGTGLPAPVTAPPASVAAPVALPTPVAAVGVPAPAPTRPLGAPPTGQAQPVPPSSGTGIISTVPGRPAGIGVAPASPPPPPPPPAPPVPPQAPLAARSDVPTAAGPFSPMPMPMPPVDDDAEMTVASLAAVAPVNGVRLVFDTGTVLPVSGRGRIGRDPVVGDEPVAHLVPLPDTTKSVSKTHLEFVLADGGLWVCDLHSTNGSSIERAGARTALVAGDWALAEAGAVVHVGSRTFRVEVP